MLVKDATTAARSKRGCILVSVRVWLRRYSTYLCSSLLNQLGMWYIARSNCISQWFSFLDFPKKWKSEQRKITVFMRHIIIVTSLGLIEYLVLVFEIISNGQWSSGIVSSWRMLALYIQDILWESWSVRVCWFWGLLPFSRNDSPWFPWFPQFTGSGMFRRKSQNESQLPVAYTVQNVGQISNSDSNLIKKHMQNISRIFVLYNRL